MNFLIKPASGLCNMRCRYCFYEDETNHRSDKNLGIMDTRTADILIEEAFRNASRQEGVTFSFQGGEPTLAGIDFFRHFVEQVQLRNQHYRVPVQYAIQTNGLVLSDELLELFAKHHFLVGVSLDGTKAIHDTHRIDSRSQGTWGNILHNLNRLTERKVDVNILCVVTKTCARSPRKVYAGLKKLGCNYLQFIACLDPLETARGQMPYSLLPEEYGKFLCGLFDAWYLDWKNGSYVSIRLFDDYIHLAMGLPAGTCATSGNCGKYYVSEADGSIYPCDFYVLDQWKLGKIGENSLADIMESPRAAEFFHEGMARPKRCAACKWEPLCGGGCRRDWTEVNGETENYYCSAFTSFFSYAYPRIQEIARAEYQALRQAHRR